MMQFIMCGCLPKSSISWGLVALQTSTEVAQGTEQRALRHSIYPKSRLGISQKDRKPWCSPRSISKLKKKCNIWSVGAQTGNQLIWREKHWVTVPSMLGTIKNKMSKSLLKAHLVDLVSALHSYLAGICITQPFTPRLIFGGWSEHFYEQFFWHLSVHNEPPLNFLMYIQTKLVIQIQLVCLWSGSESALSALFLWSMLPISSGMMGCLETPHLCALWLVLGSEMAGCWAHFLAQQSQQTVE